MEKKQKIWAEGVSMKASLQNGKSLIRTSYNVEKFVKFLKANENDRGYVNIDSWERETPGKFGETHNSSLNDWKPDPSKSKATAQVENEGDDLPF